MKGIVICRLMDKVVFLLSLVFSGFGVIFWFLWIFNGLFFEVVGSFFVLRVSGRFSFFGFRCRVFVLVI